MDPGVAIVGSCVAWPWCLMSPVFSVGGVGGGVSSELSVGDVGKAAVGNTVLAPGPSVRLLSRSPVFWRAGVGVGECCCHAAADDQFLVRDAAAALE